MVGSTRYVIVFGNLCGTVGRPTRDPKAVRPRTGFRQFNISSRRHRFDQLVRCSYSYRADQGLDNSKCWRLLTEWPLERSKDSRVNPKSFAGLDYHTFLDSVDDTCQFLLLASKSCSQLIATYQTNIPRGRSTVHNAASHLISPALLDRIMSKRLLPSACRFASQVARRKFPPSHPEAGP